MAPFGPADSRAASHCCADPIGAAQRGLLGASEADWKVNGLDDSQNQGGLTHFAARPPLPEYAVSVREAGEPARLLKADGKAGWICS
jgi:hypothetical protein